ncbi:MAG TPA: SAM-dependent methyltransferase [Opitutus sp.]|nr:SAM-dependent methyltransferase [Opitutus sp.]
MNASTRPSPEFLAAFRAAAGESGVMPFDRFMDLALYHPQLGYYRRSRGRVGYAPGTDFFTASTSGPIFGELVAAACTSLLAPAAVGDFTFVEIGAEPGGHVLQGVAHPFRDVRTLRLGDPLQLDGRCIVFSNELFDAQPFRRFVYRSGAWRELGVRVEADALLEAELDLADPPASLPVSHVEGYAIDYPAEAVSLLDRLAAEPWTGLFVACDYGKTWSELIEHCPHGTARAYANHVQSNDLLARPGEQDLTCHICWDWLSAALARAGFSAPIVESQESFFIRRAEAFISAAIAADARGFSPRKLSLLQLLHPTHLGQKFQVLHARRE